MSKRAWFEFLSEEDLAFVQRLVLASGSLKQIAQQYGVTYPTIRLRLDRLIAKIEAVEQHTEVSEFERLLRAQLADQKISLETFRELLSAHLKEQETANGQSDSA
ncbi:MAG: DUF2089 family protein [Fuerstiella sp.]